eukprot:TRINITY_DN7113_c0_g1_i1.p1 TRINITY_DN7113_c0_g1~~TRINITY_DN7113_c0_g1_i1.p1  ORF type:complete len:301 (-),score=133.60 TRINITY_DN7113_c0_g1_i1:43-912(-)
MPVSPFKKLIKEIKECELRILELRKDVKSLEKECDEMKMEDKDAGKSVQSWESSILAAKQNIEKHKTDLASKQAEEDAIPEAKKGKLKHRMLIKNMETTKTLIVREEENLVKYQVGLVAAVEKQKSFEDAGENKEATLQKISSELDEKEKHLVELKANFNEVLANGVSASDVSVLRKQLEDMVKVLDSKVDDVSKEQQKHAETLQDFALNFEELKMQSENLASGNGNTEDVEQKLEDISRLLKEQAEEMEEAMDFLAESNSDMAQQLQDMREEVRDQLNQEVNVEEDDE